MVHWTDHERHVIADIWGKVNPDEIGPQALARLLIVYPWTQRYFASFGNLSNAAAILGNPKVAAHGKVVVGGLEKAVKHLDTVKGIYTKLSELHSEKLHVDPSNFTLLADCLTITLAAKFGPSVFTPDVHEVWQKFLNVVVAALCKQYH
ncbi:hemoglobin subunit beta [Silurus meridionalis]|uniref:hemoglobin subunit beta n=1 Tax=Silurus meridionalis TaxID=175797 RepID=UPI001EECAAC3|nr:hemoglobin subunit beta [Silurus meridionalis]KAI5091575.1 hemoglobin subunit beta-1 [Silurus meridionalis]